MSELQTRETYQQKIERLNGLSGRFLTAWAQAHGSIRDIGILPFDPQNFPFQAVNHHKTLSFAATHGIDLAAYRDLLDYNLTHSFKDPAKVEAFKSSMAQEYPYPGGNGRSFTQVLAQDFLRQGLSVAATLGHPEERLTDSPRFVTTQALDLANEYGDEFAKDLGLVAGAPLKLETYKGHDIDGMLALTSDVYYTNTKSQNTDTYRQLAGLSQEELQEISTFMNLGFGRALMTDSRPKKAYDDKPAEHGHLIVINPTGTRAVITKDADGEPESIVLPSVEPNTGRLMSGFSAYWPNVVIGDEIKLGPFIPLERPPKEEYSRDELERLYLQRVEDTMDIVAAMIDEVLGKKGIAQYSRLTHSGDIFRDYFIKGRGTLGDRAIQAALIGAEMFDATSTPNL